MTLRLILAAATLATCATAAMAEVDLAAVDACIDTARAANQPPTACIDEAHALCQSEGSETITVAILCFQKAREAWGEGIKTRMAAIQDQAPQEIAAIAGIEVKYDLLASLMQCDRLEELARLGDGPADEIQRNVARCAATASGLAYTRLVWRSADMPLKEN